MNKNSLNKNKLKKNMDGKSLTRRNVLKSTGAASVGFAGLGQVSAKSLDTKIEFSEIGLFFSVDYPDDFQKMSSRAHIDEPNRHVVDEEANELYLNPDVPDQIVTKLQSGSPVTFADDYKVIPRLGDSVTIGLPHPGLLPTELAYDTRQTKALELASSVSITEPEVTYSGDVVEVSTDAGTQSVQPENDATIKLPALEVDVMEGLPGSHERNSLETNSTELVQRSLRVTPQLQVINHGSLNVNKTEIIGK